MPSNRPAFYFALWIPILFGPALAWGCRWADLAPQTKVGEGWNDASEAKERWRSVLTHQNELRDAKKLPRLAGEATRRTHEGKLLFQVEVADAFPDDPIVGNFIMVGDWLLRARHNDIFALNQAYRFEGGKLVESRPLSDWLLAKMPDTVTVYRQMSPEEHALWKSGELGKVGKDWGHGEPVVHLATDRNHTTAAGAASNPIVEIQISKQALLELSRSGKVWSAVLDPAAMASELVLPAAQIKALADSGQLRVGLKR